MAVFNFASGPSTLPPEVVAALARDVADWQESGMSALELPFTGPTFAGILAEAERDLRTLLALPANYKVLFLQGGASAQFALLPMNLLRPLDTADYVASGHWSRRAIEEASSVCRLRVIASGSPSHLPPPATWDRSPGAAYCHFTSNETADGLQFHEFPEAGGTPLVADMTADFLTRPIPVERFGLIYASGQKNLGAAGLTIIVMRDDLLAGARRGTPGPFDYARQAEAKSKVNTPPTFAVLAAGRMLRWLLDGGGLAAAAARSNARSAKLYAAIDADDFYRCPASPAFRSVINICFRLPTQALEASFLEEAQANGLLNLAGHRNVGGIRASLYNAVPDAAVDALAAFMSDFKRRRG